jgi:hypothetical protein
MPLSVDSSAVVSAATLSFSANQLQLIPPAGSETLEAWTSSMDIWNGTPEER